jgi:hypothetical protein
MLKLSLIRKLFVGLIIITPLITDMACKKQPSCGCGKDVVFSFYEESVNIFFNVTTKAASFSVPYDPYSTYNFCNPEDMMETLSKFRSGQLLLLSGKAYYDCNYVLNASDNPYYAQYKVYMVEVTEIKEDLYGK